MAQPQEFPFNIMDVAELLHLHIRRRQADSVYADCPICGDKRGKMNINFAKNLWRCNYCNEGGGMLSLYGKVYGISNSEAYREICDTLQNGLTAPEYTAKVLPEQAAIEQSVLASPQEIHQTFSMLLELLTLTPQHRKHLREVRGLTDEQIERLGYKSTPPFYLCRSLAQKLRSRGCKVEGVPGFYVGKDDKWTVNFNSVTAGIIIPAKGIDGMIRGAQIRLDTPIREQESDPDKSGTKYLWLSSASKKRGVSSGSPVHFVGDPFARVVYVTEGLLKADVAHFLMDRSFAATAGANNVNKLDMLFALLAANGTEVIIEAEDMDKYHNAAVSKGASKIYLMARSHGLECRRLTWDPNYKGIDDWQLAMRQKKEQRDVSQMNFRTRFVCGLCSFDAISEEIAAWHERNICSSIPENAVWTREKLLETILNHKYLSDGFGLDMVTMLMQSIAPYQNDPVYGERVKAKLWEGFDIVMNSFGTDPFDNPFGVQWGGVYTSEGASQIICALSAMGVDVHTDVRLNNGKDSVLTSFLNYADFDEGYFAHSNTTPKNAMATYQGCYATQWYLGFLKGGGAGHPYSLYYHCFDFSRKLSTEADITSFTLEGKKGVFTTEGGDNIITVTLPAGTPLNDMHPQLQLSDYATILAPDLTGGITFVKDTKTAFTVQAEDGKTTKTYYVVVKLSEEEKPSGAEIYTDTIMLKDANILRDLDILGKNITTGADSTDIELLLDAGKDTSNLMIYARLSYGATASPALDGKKGMNLSDWTTFTITSGDGTNTRTYRIKATARTQASISAFSLTIGGTVYEGVIDDKANTITVSGVDDSKLSSTSFAPDVTLGPETLVCSPAPGLAQDFSRTVQYIVAGNEKVLSRTYTVSVLNKAGQLISGSGGGGGSDPVTPATGAKITAFSVLGVDGVINQSAGTITVTLPAGTNVTAVDPSVTVTAGAVVSPVPGEVVNLTVPVVYTVTLGEETSRYTVTVTFERSVSQQLWDELGNNSDVADHQASHTKRDWS